MSIRVEETKINTFKPEGDTATTFIDKCSPYITESEDLKSRIQTCIKTNFSKLIQFDVTVKTAKNDPKPGKKTEQRTYTVIHSGLFRNTETHFEGAKQVSDYRPISNQIEQNPIRSDGTNVKNTSKEELGCFSKLCAFLSALISKIIAIFKSLFCCSVKTA